MPCSHGYIYTLILQKLQNGNGSEEEQGQTGHSFKWRLLIAYDGTRFSGSNFFFFADRLHAHPRGVELLTSGKGVKSLTKLPFINK